MKLKLDILCVYIYIIMYHIRLNIHIAKSDMMCQDWNNKIVTTGWPPINSHHWYWMYFSGE